MNRAEVYKWLCDNPPEMEYIIHRLLKEDVLSIWEMVKLQETAMKSSVRDNRLDACEGAVIACLYRDEMYGNGKNYASKQEVDERARRFINKVGCFTEIKKK